jgi:Na+/proline symporter
MGASEKLRARRARRIRRLRRLSVLVGVACIAIAVLMLLTTTVAIDKGVESINGQHDTNSVILELGMLCLGVVLLAFGLP